MWLKHANLANHKFDTSDGYKDAMKNFRSAIITHEPEITVVDLCERDRWLVLATDGMWNSLKRGDIASTVAQVDKA